ncbi:MAG: SGNH/GDSL hydrolase family protein [Planctomycetes bacterium]|nr:SGNH/GDSL hydrolase family protein [Planctomycetota bacterium]
MDELSIEQLEQCTRGVIDITEENGGIVFRRFPGKIAEYYHSQAEGTAIRADCAAGIVIDFWTDAEKLEISCDLPAGARAFGYVDVYCDRQFVKSLGNANSCEHIDGQIVLPETNISNKHIEIYLPHCRITILRSLSVSDGATVEATELNPLVLNLGDSITQGMNSHYPSLIYPAICNRLMGFTTHNAGVGGDIFNVESLRECPVDSPVQITVAYGINDFNGDRDASPAAPYLARLRKLYPEVPVAVLEPIWASREGFDQNPGKNDAGITLPEYRTQLRDIVSDFDNMRCLRSSQILPPDESFVPDGIHPNTVGHQVMGYNLYELIGRQPPRKT